MKNTTPRPFKLDYGATQGHCADAPSSVLSALRYMKAHGKKHSVIEQPNGPPVDIWWSGFFGVTVSVRKHNVVPLKKRA